MTWPHVLCALAKGAQVQPAAFGAKVFLISRNRGEKENTGLLWMTFISWPQESSLQWVK